jgi:hypothetical protein
VEPYAKELKPYRQPGKRKNLPKEHVERMMSWIHQNLGHAYPTEADKQWFVTESRGELSRFTRFEK